MKLSPCKKSKKTGRWAKTMARWGITCASKGRPWKIVSFDGPQGSESRGIVDLLAIRKDHNRGEKPLERGDKFEIILIQVKGGNAAVPTREDVIRLKAVAKYYHAKEVVLAEWAKEKKRLFKKLTISDEWKKVDPKVLFK